jgi:hypothetical protein
MDIKEKISKQLSAGYSNTEIYDNLLSDGHPREEIDQEFTLIAQEAKERSQVSTKGILLGSLFLLIVVFRIFRFSGSSGTGAVFAFISIITGVLLVIYWFTRKKR